MQLTLVFSADAPVRSPVHYTHLIQSAFANTDLPIHIILRGETCGAG